MSHLCWVHSAHACHFVRRGHILCAASMPYAVDVDCRPYRLSCIERTSCNAIRWKKKRIPWLCDTRKCRGGCHIIASVAAPRDFFSFLFMYSRSISDACDRFSNRLHAICVARTRNTNAVRPAVMGSQMTNIIGRYLCISNKEACSLLSVLPVLSVLLYSLRPVASKLCCCQTRVRFRYYVIHFVKWGSIIFRMVLR